MMKKDRLYKVDKRNKNLFWNGGGTDSTNKQAGDYTYSLNNVGNWMSNLNNNSSNSGYTGSNRLSGVSVYTGNTGKPTGPTNAQMQNTFGQINSYAAGLNQGAKNANGGSSAAQGISGGSGWEQAGSGLASALPSGEMTVGGNYYRRGVYDAADPLYYVAGGRESEVGNTLSDIGVSLTQNGGKWGALAGSGFKITGDLWNALGGEKTNKELLAATNDTSNKNKNFRSNAQGFDDIVMPIAGNTSALNSDVYEGSLFHSVGSKNDDLRNNLIAALDWSDRSVTNNVDNLHKDQLNRAYANYNAYGGPMERIPFPQPYPMQNNMGALEYNVMSDMLTNKKQQTENKNTMSNTGNVFLNSPNGWYGLGGVVQTHGGDFSSGLVRVNAGKSHEENPYQGVQMGVDSEGTPNLVEEGETVFNDYVYSNRIYADGGTLKKFHLPKKAKLTYAEISKKLEAEIKERPNDPISKAGFKAQMEMLADEQERQKAEMEAARAREAFEALSDEEKVAIMQRAAEEEQMAQQAMAAEAQQQTQQPTPEEMAIAEQQAEPSSEEILAQQQAQVAALGGRLVKAGDVTEKDTNMFAGGGRKARKAAKRYNKDWFLAQAKSLGMIGDDATDIEGWEFNPKDPETNLSTFNNKFKDFQKKKALETYRTGQRKSKENELFGSNGLYRYSDDKSKIFKARTNDKDRIGWINADYTGAIDDDGNLKGFLSQEDYNKLSDKDKEAYKRINERAGDRMYDFRGKAIEDIYNGNVDDILGAYNYNDGFKWDDKDVQTLQYPVDMEKSDLSYLRYVPALGGAIGLFNDIISPADYSNAEAVEEAGSIVPMFVHPNYNPTYMKPHVFDVWQQRNRNAANLNSAIRTFENTNNPNKSANILAALYNATNLDGQLGIDADKYNREDAFKVAAHNSGENKTLAQLDMQAQLANQRVYDDAQRLGFQGKLYGARMRDDIDARRNASMNANLTNVLQSIGNIGEEAYDEDRLRWLERTGTLRSNVYDKDKYTAKNGGKLRRKRGLTY